MGHAAGSPLTIEKRDDHIALVTINRPEARNAIDGQVTPALEATSMTSSRTSGRLPSERAAALGMVNRLVPAGQAIPAALELAAAIAANAPVALRESLAIACVADDHDEDTLRALMDAARQRIVGTEDYREGPRTFIEKRKPIWVGR